MADARLAVLLRSPSPLPPTALTSRRLTKCGRSRFFLPPSAAYTLQRRKGSSGFMAHAIASETVETKWWEKNTAPNMIDIHSSKEFIEALSQAGDKLVVVDFYGTWCHSCRSLFPKICKIAEENQDILFLKVNFDENQQMCRRLNVIVLPYFHFYRGAEGNLESFPGSLLTLHRIRNAIATHNTARCSLGPPLGVGDLDLLDISSPHEESAQAKDK